MENYIRGTEGIDAAMGYLTDFQLYTNPPESQSSRLFDYM